MAVGTNSEIACGGINSKYAQKELLFVIFNNHVWKTVEKYSFFCRKKLTKLIFLFTRMLSKFALSKLKNEHFRNIRKQDLENRLPDFIRH